METKRLGGAGGIGRAANGTIHAYMFDAFFHRQLGPLILVSAAFTAGAAILIWLLPEKASDQNL